MLFHLSALPLVMFLGAIGCTTASRCEDDDGLPALTHQANDHQQIVYDVDNGVNTSFACTEQDLKRLWDSGVQTHLNKRPNDGCDGGHAVSRYLTALSDATPKIQNVLINSFNNNTGLLTVASYEYRTTSAPWPANPLKTKTLWNDGGANLGQRLKDSGVNLPANFPLQGWISYQYISFPRSEVEQQCKRSLQALQCVPRTNGSYVVPPAIVNVPNLCVRVAMTQEGNNLATCYPVGVNAAAGVVGTAC